MFEIPASGIRTRLRRSRPARLFATSQSVPAGQNQVGRCCSQPPVSVTQTVLIFHPPSCGICAYPCVCVQGSPPAVSTRSDPTDVSDTSPWSWDTGRRAGTDFLLRTLLCPTAWTVEEGGSTQSGGRDIPHLSLHPQPHPCPCSPRSWSLFPRILVLVPSDIHPCSLRSLSVPLASQFCSFRSSPLFLGILVPVPSDIHPCFLE